MTWARLIGLLAPILNWRRNRWIEISVTRAWSHDMPARLFDLSDK